MVLTFAQSVDTNTDQYYLYLTFSDVVTIEKTGENFRFIYDVKGRFTVHRIQPEEAKVRHKDLSASIRPILHLCLPQGSHLSWKIMEFCKV